MKRLIVPLMALLVVGTAEAQSVPPVSPSPSSGLPAHMMLPWGIGIVNPNAQVLGKRWILPRAVVLDTYLPVSEAPLSETMAAASTTVAQTDGATSAGTSPQYTLWRQTAIVPGYWVTDTTAGVYYSQRWELEQTAPFTYRWRLLPAGMFPR